MKRIDPNSPDIDSPVFRRAGQMAIHVQQKESPWTLALGIAVAIVLGVIVFATLSAGRQARADDTTPQKLVVAQAAPPPAPPAPIVDQTPPPAPAPAPVPAAPPANPDESLGLHAPMMVVDQSVSQSQSTTTSTSSAAPGHEATGNAEERFEAQVAGGGVETAHATQLTDLRHTIPQGTMIPAVLETAINTDLPGGVRAVVSRDVAGFDGAQVLIPRGSKLIGQYRSGMAYGQSRAFVVWSRIITPDGVSVDVGSPGTDALGRGGLSGKVDTHFFERFGSSILLSVISAGASAATLAGGSSAIIIGSPIQAGSLATMAPQTTNIPVTIKVMQGSPVQVFLVRDLDFSGVAAAGR